MPSGTLTLFDATLNALLRCALPSLETAPYTALLLAPGYVPNAATHSVFADVEAFELTSSEAVRVQLTGGLVTAAAFHSDDIIFGDPVTLGPVRYMALLAGVPAALTSSSILLGVADLLPGGGALEAQRGRFSVSAPAAGWFSLTRAI